MAKAGEERDHSQSLDPPLPSLPANDEVEPIGQPQRSPITRPGFGTEGKHIRLLANHYKVSIRNSGENFYQYSVRYTIILAFLCIQNASKCAF